MSRNKILVGHTFPCTLELNSCSFNDFHSYLGRTLTNQKAAIRQCGFQQLNHPPYSPDLAPSNYFLFQVTKKFLRGKRFSSDEEVKEQS